MTTKTLAHDVTVYSQYTRVIHPFIGATAHHLAIYILLYGFGRTRSQLGLGKHANYGLLLVLFSMKGGSTFKVLRSVMPLDTDRRVS